MITGDSFRNFWKAKLDAYVADLIEKKYQDAHNTFIAAGGQEQYWTAQAARDGITADVHNQMDGLLGTGGAGYTDGLLYQIFVFMSDSAEVQSVVIGSGIPVAIDPLDPLVGATTADGEQSGTGRIQ